MRSIKLLPVLLFAFASIFSSCKPKEPTDTVAPSIKTVTINNRVSNISLERGEQVQLVIAANDNISLSEISISIHDAFDGHGHKNNTPWTYTNVIPASGTTTTKQLTVEVPEDAAGGPYHLTAVAVDAAGNISKAVERLFYIEGQGQPTINITSPDFTNGFAIERGDSIIIQGNVTDDTDLAEVEIIVVREGAPSGEAPVYKELFALPGTDDVQFDFAELSAQGKTIVIPETASADTYEIIIKAKDNEGNYTFASTEFQVTE